MGDPAEPLPTFEALYEEIRKLPEHLTGEILVPGVIRTMSRPGKRHRKAHGSLGRSLDSFDRNFRGTGWWIEVEAEIRFPQGRLLVPDLSGFRVERVPQLPDENPLTVLPDWCCEILSPTTERVDRLTKLPLYAKSGVPWIWLVDPEKQSVEVYETIDGRPALTALGSDEVRATLPPFGDLEIASWWLPRTEQAG